MVSNYSISNALQDFKYWVSGNANKKFDNLDFAAKFYINKTASESTKEIAKKVFGDNSMFGVRTIFEKSVYTLVKSRITREYPEYLNSQLFLFAIHLRESIIK